VHKEWPHATESLGHPPGKTYMPLTYLDQVALLKLGYSAKDDGFRASVNAVIASGLVTVVVSSWHLVETAHKTNLQKAIALAEFIDSLNPMWLLERLNIMKLDVEEDFYRFANVDFEPMPRVTTRSAAIGSLLGERDSPRYDIPSRDFVRQWIERPDQTAVLDRSYRGNAEALTWARGLAAAGKMTSPVTAAIDREYLRRLIPARTRSGLDTGRELRDQYLEQADVRRIPSLAIETAISKREWVSQGGADRNTLIDKMHLTAALPYTDEIVSDDRFFHRLYPITETTGHVRARLLSCEDFLKRF